MTRSFNLRQRFSLTVLFAIALASTVMLLSIYWAVSNYTRQYTIHYWQEYAETFAHSAKFSVTLASPVKANEIVDHFKKDPVIEKTGIYLRSGERLASTEGAIECPITATNRFDANRVEHPFVFELPRTWCFYAPIHYLPETHDFLDPEPSENTNKTPIGFVELVVSKRGMENVIQKILWLSIASVIVFELLIFVSVQHFSDVWTRALLDLAEVMKKTGEGSRGVRTSLEGPAEIIELKQRLNRMLDQLEAQEEELEDTVAARTAELQTALNSALSASRYKSTIISTVSHEMKSPLHAFMGYSQLALEALNGSSQLTAEDCLQMGLDCARNLEHQINQILDYARLESGKAQLYIAKFNFRNLVLRCVEKIEPLTKDSGNRIRMTGEAAEIDTDQDKLTHIVMNLLSNANKFTQQGRIEIAWSIHRAQLTIRVSDTGCGIAEADRDKIFEPFWQADMSLSRPAGGTGLGLAITKLYCELLTGEIDVTSNNPGSVFTVTLPIAKA
ncbi:sensor histidine kinase [Methylotuvimicrobium sp.]|uniref:sensor histidine kinase n=1 Tax=Methylotuvimicrobium sp. TaxID=2822413 RepID=UPI003D6532D2